MAANLSLIKNNENPIEKRILPRFPFSSLLFRSYEQCAHSFEVKEISMTGMQLGLKDGDAPFTPGATLKGTLLWRKARLDIEAEIKWVKGGHLGVHFKNDKEDLIKNFLSMENILGSLRTVPLKDMDINLPANLQFWLCADGPVEIFIWSPFSTDIAGHIDKFQIFFFERYVEWDREWGTVTGKVVTKRNFDTPLILADEMYFQKDIRLERTMLKQSSDLLHHLTAPSFPLQVRNFLLDRMAAV